MQTLKNTTQLTALFLVASPLTVILAQDAPNSSLYSGQLQRARQQQVRYQQPEDLEAGASSPVLPSAYDSGPVTSSWYEIPLPPPREAKVNDIITIRVDMGARVTSEGQFQRRKNASYDAILQNWVLLDGLRSVKPSPQSDGDPRIQGALNQLSRTQADLETTEAIKFDIAAKVNAILPNGTLVLEARREIRNNNETWLASLSGVCRREDIQPGNVVLSKDIAELKIDKREVGAVRDSYRRGWFTRFYDTFNPF